MEYISVIFAVVFKVPEISTFVSLGEILTKGTAANP
jgi:hypothetical protein